jgi:adenosyl cobinamide kinase/adenosyl cobinamide phosphate guanylyltransferase
MKLTDKAPSTTHRVLIFGAPKSGKSQLASSLASQYNLLWFDLENGYGTLLKLPKDQQEKIELISIPDSKTFPIAIETMLKVVTGNECNICEEHGKVSCPICSKVESAKWSKVCLKELSSDTVVVIDSLSQLSNSAIAFITKGQPDDYKMEFSDWGNLRAIVEKFLSQIQQARYNIVCISHEEEVEMEDGRKKIVPVCGSSKSSRNTAKYFDHVLYCELKNKKHITASSTTYANNILTGSRTDIVMDQDVNPTLLSIFKKQTVPTSSNANTQGQTALNQLKQSISTTSLKK